MKKTFLTLATALACLFMYSCSSDKEDGPTDPIDPTDPDPPTEVVEEESLQFTNKTITLPVENFPAIDVSANEITLLKGDYAAVKDGVQFDGDLFAEGVLIEDGEVISIRQDQKDLVKFTTKTGGSGARIKIEGIGSTSALTAAEGVGRGIYFYTIRPVDANSSGYLKGTRLYTSGNESNLVQTLQLEGGRKYLLRRDHVPESGNPKDIEGWIFFPWVADMSGGYATDNHLKAMSIYPEEAYRLPVEQQVPILTSHSTPEAAYYTFRITNFVNLNPANPGEETEENLWYYAQGNGYLSAYITMNSLSVDMSDYDVIAEGLDPEVGNDDPWARAFGVNAEFLLYIAADYGNITEADLATPEQYREFVSNDGVDPGEKYLVVKLTEPEEMVNTMEDMTFIFKRRANANDPTARIRFEGLYYDENLGCMVTDTGMNFRSVPGPAEGGE